MKTIDQPAAMNPAVKAQMQEACDRISKGIPFTRQERDQAAAEIDRMREENSKRLGIQNVAVDAVRQSRDSR